MGFVSEDGIPYGSIDVNDIENADPKTDEAKAVVERMKAEIQQGQEQVAADQERLAAGDRAPGSEPVPDTRDAQGKPAGFDEKPAESKSADEKQAPKKQAPSSHDKG